MVLQALYDEDIVDEDLIVAWYAKPSAANILGVEPSAATGVREAAKAFVEWLEEAESDEDSD